MEASRSGSAQLANTSQEGFAVANLMNVLEEALLLLVVQGVSMGDVVQSLL